MRDKLKTLALLAVALFALWCAVKNARAQEETSVQKLYWYVTEHGAAADKSFLSFTAVFTTRRGVCPTSEMKVTALSNEMLGFSFYGALPYALRDRAITIHAPVVALIDIASGEYIGGAAPVIEDANKMIMPPHGVIEHLIDACIVDILTHVQ